MEQEQKKKIYLAGGWFTPEQEELHTRIYELIKDNYNVFNPKMLTKLPDKPNQDQMSATLLANCKGIKDADLVLVIYDYKDTGTIWEAGYAYANNKPIIYYSETTNGKINLMLAKTGKFVCTTIDMLTELVNPRSYIFNSLHTFDGVVE